MPNTQYVDAPHQTDETDELHLRALLDYVDSRADRAGRHAGNKRRTQRRALRAPCTVHFLARDGATVLSTSGKTRDISRTGLSFVSKRHLAPDTRLRIAVRLADGRTYRFAGVVVQSRSIRGEWYLAGVRLENSQAPRPDSKTGPPAGSG